MQTDRREFVALCGGVFAGSLLAAGPAVARGLQASEPSSGGRKKVIIDTDPGVDDAFALLPAMSSPEIDLLAVTSATSPGCSRTRRPISEHRVWLRSPYLHGGIFTPHTRCRVNQ